MLDASSRAILRYLQDDPSLTVPELAARTGLTPARVARRIDKLAEDGIVIGQSARINWPALGYTVEVSLRITLDKAVPNAFEAILTAARQIPEVIEIQTFLGRVDLRLALVARDLADYQRVYREAVLTLPHIADIEALMTVAKVKDTESLPL